MSAPGEGCLAEGVAVAGVEGAVGTLGEDGEAGDDEVALGIRGGGAVEAPGVLHVGAGDRVPALAPVPATLRPGTATSRWSSPGLRG